MDSVFKVLPSLLGRCTVATNGHLHIVLPFEVEKLIDVFGRCVRDSSEVEYVAYALLSWTNGSLLSCVVGDEVAVLEVQTVLESESAAKRHKKTNSRKGSAVSAKDILHVYNIAEHIVDHLEAEDDHEHDDEGQPIWVIEADSAGNLTALQKNRPPPQRIASLLSEFKELLEAGAQSETQYVADELKKHQPTSSSASSSGPAAAPAGFDSSWENSIEALKTQLSKDDASLDMSAVGCEEEAILTRSFLSRAGADSGLDIPTQEPEIPDAELSPTELPQDVREQLLKTWAKGLLLFYDALVASRQPDLQSIKSKHLSLVATHAVSVVTWAECSLEGLVSDRARFGLEAAASGVAIDHTSIQWLVWDDVVQHTGRLTRLDDTDCLVYQLPSERTCFKQLHESDQLQILIPNTSTRSP